MCKITDRYGPRFPLLHFLSPRTTEQGNPGKIEGRKLSDKRAAARQLGRLEGLQNKCGSLLWWIALQGFPGLQGSGDCRGLPICDYSTSKGNSVSPRTDIMFNVIRIIISFIGIRVFELEIIRQNPWTS